MGASVPIPVSNFSFEVLGAQKDGNWNGLPMPSASSKWVDDTGAYSGYQIDRAPDNFSAAADGTHFLNLGSVSQDLSYSVNTGDMITLNFAAGHDTNHPSTTLTAYILVNNTVVGTLPVDLSTAQSGVWNPETFTATAVAPGDVSIQFVNDNKGTNFIDNVSASATPEPSAIGLLGIGAASLIARRRRV